MNPIFRRLLQLAGACIAAMAFGPAIAQINNVTDGTTTSAACTSYTFSATGVLTFSPAGCLAGSGPPPATPVYSFTAGAVQVVETTATSTVTVRRTGSDLTTAGSVIVRYTGGTAAGQVNFNLNLPPFVVAGSDLQYPMTFAPAASGVTTQEVSFNVLVINASLPGGNTKTVSFGLLSPTGGNLGATTSHTLTIASALPPPSANDVSTSGTAIPDSLAPGSYAGLTLVCENFQAVGVPGTPTPGQGGRTPCGGYDYAVANPNRQAGAYNCNSGMSGVPTPANAFRPAINNTVDSATMFMLEDLKIGNTHIPGVDFRYPQHQYNAFIIKFRTGNAGELTGAIPNSNVIGTYNFSFVAQENRGEIATRFAALSTKPCDFDYTKFDAGDGCYRNLDQNGGGSMLVQILNGGQAAAGKCGLQPNTVYYLSTRWEDVGFAGFGPARGLTSCKPGYTNQVGLHYCGTSLSIN
ncbi:MAG: hypothetical protein IPL06_05405 [Betaproteobacteria bacterium]|nr:hypothetical protein [Betaproteobacteria bacterium]